MIKPRVCCITALNSRLVKWTLAHLIYAGILSTLRKNPAPPINGFDGKQTSFLIFMKMFRINIVALVAVLRKLYENVWGVLRLFIVIKYTYLTCNNLYLYEVFLRKIRQTFRSLYSKHQPKR